MTMSFGYKHERFLESPGLHSEILLKCILTFKPLHGKSDPACQNSYQSVGSAVLKEMEPKMDRQTDAISCFKGAV